MPTTNLNNSVDAGTLDSADTADYSAARAGAGDQGITKFTVGDIGNIQFGNDFVGDPTYQVLQAFLIFDLSAAGIPAGATVSSASIAFRRVLADAADADWTVELRASNWGNSLATGDFVAGDDLSGLALLASCAASALNVGSDTTLTNSGTALKDACQTALAGDGRLRVILASSQTRNGDTPTGSNRVIFGAVGGGVPPTLSVTYTAAGGLFRTAALTGLGSGGPFFQNPIN